MNQAKNKIKKKIPKPKIAVGISQSDVKTFLEKFRADVVGKVKKYRKFAQESQKKKNP